jgi:hypothetical protein
MFQQKLVHTSNLSDMFQLTSYSEGNLDKHFLQEVPKFTFSLQVIIKPHG